jgi:hypothetical protein
LAAAVSADSVGYFTVGLMAAVSADLAAMASVGTTPERSMADGTEDMVPTFMPVGTGRGMAATDVGMAAMVVAMAVAMVVAMAVAMAAAMVVAMVVAMAAAMAAAMVVAMAAADITTAAMAAADITTRHITATAVVAIRVSAIAVGHGDPASVSFVSQTAGLGVDSSPSRYADKPSWP